MATQANIYIDQGTNFSTGLDVVGDNGYVVDLTSATMVGKARKVFSTDVVFDFTITIPFPEEGKAIISLDAATTSVLRPGKYKYDVLVYTAYNDTVKILEGIVYIVDTVTVA